MIVSIIFTLLLITTFSIFGLRIRKIFQNVSVGKTFDRTDQPMRRFILMCKVAIGQSKMVTRPVAGVLHIFVYLGFIIINIEVLEIFIDGVFGTHRIFLPILGSGYSLFINIFETLAILVIIACVTFLIRRNVIKVKRFWSAEMTSWPRSDANIILITEILLMTAFLTMDASDQLLQGRGELAYHETGNFFFSSIFSGLFSNMSTGGLIYLERFTWWFHIIGIMAFMIYVPYSKHFHIFLAFPNVYYSNLDEKGKMNHLESVTTEVKLMMDPDADPYATPADGGEKAGRFGAKDVVDLSRKQLMDAYCCTECGRCTSSCPANQTGKKLSPRKIMMDTRDRLEEFGKVNNEEKTLLFDYVSEEEIWACTTCNACTEACPINIDPLSIIIDLRRYLIMEESKMPSELMTMSSNIENNGAPWQFAAADRGNWVNEGT